ncbi:DUF3846 domain-containing protein [Mycobacteroides abscessus]|uniref:DUF3846 domain-containing protein n=1 Tax=Mycobacteroides abscessus TaxID=36809 RepID=UPI00092CCA6B|nr:DUF3846 domain-containing protein [Mycobacteroides abscessus]SIC59005.1 Domain of uncharacterised function (DUF3846) [Mycobacteroides abscessus subsp. abscessus]
MTIIKGILIPADELQDIKTVEIDSASDVAIQAHVGGTFGVTDLFNPAASLHWNDDGRMLGLPLNRRATLMLWVHHSAFRGHDALLGDVLLLGPADEETGDSLPVPDELDRLLFHTDQYRYLVKTIGEKSWNGNGVTYDNWVDAYNGALSLAKRWTLVEEVTVVAA